ncbi:MAG: hypothetical protein WCJ30_08720 [Deltaproteobacteria bacterium]
MDQFSGVGAHDAMVPAVARRTPIKLREAEEVMCIRYHLDGRSPTRLMTSCSFESRRCCERDLAETFGRIAGRIGHHLDEELVALEEIGELAERPQ